ncbi:hypothetical protein K438DRAFT_1876963 [Mycena galopus ATCC 62051]|nr:hypothetical protein K438DRAFT_1876963 [Mycena galopus ATCC 62051]
MTAPLLLRFSTTTLTFCAPYLVFEIFQCCYPLAVRFWLYNKMTDHCILPAVTCYSTFGFESPILTILHLDIVTLPH